MNVKRIAYWPIFLWLVAIYPILFLYARNIPMFLGREVALVFLVTLLAVTILFLVVKFITGDFYKAGGIVSVVVMMFFSYGYVVTTLNVVAEMAPRFPLHLLIQALPVISLLISVLFVIVIYKLEATEKIRELSLYLNIIILVLTGFTSGKMIWGIIQYNRAFAVQDELPSRNTEIVLNSSQRPDIYYIILDGYSSNSHLLRDYGVDNSAFTDALEDRGFFVAYDSQANYGCTLMSLCSSLNMQYMHNTEYAGKVDSSTYSRLLIANNLVGQELQNLGYEYIYMLSGFVLPSAQADINVDFTSDGTQYFNMERDNREVDDTWYYRYPFWQFLRSTTLLQAAGAPSVEEGIWTFPQMSPERVLATYDEVERISNDDEATFVIAHILKPHEPVVFDRYGNTLDEYVYDGPDLEDAFFEQLEWVNARTLQMVDRIVENSSVPPIIILQADHGSNLGSQQTPDGELLYFEIFNAYYFPEGGDAVLTSDVAPVNSFRLLFNYYFDAEYELLDNHQYHLVQGYTNLFDAEEIDLER